MSIANILTRLAEKITKVFNAGKDAEWNAFWDAYQSKGARGSYTWAFYGNGWNDTTFKPKYDIIFASGGNNNTQVFNSAQFTDFAGILERQGVILDTSAYSGSNPVEWFYNCSRVTRVPTIDISNAPNGCGNLFSYCSKLHTVEKMILSENGTTFTADTFYKCTALEEIRFEGKIASDITFGNCSSLSNDSIDSIINALSDTTTGMTCTIYLTDYFGNNWDELVARKPNWRFAGA